jgi:hypothetical protein
MPFLALVLISFAVSACTEKKPIVYSGRYLAERSEDGGKSWAVDQGGLAGRGSTRSEEESYYARKMFDAGVSVCNQSGVADRAKVRVRGFHFLKEGTDPVRDDELRAALKFDMDCQSYLAARK